MLLIDVILGLAVSTLVAAGVKAKRLKRHNKMLVSQNDKMGDCLLVSGDDSGNKSKLVHHTWSVPSSDVIYKSRNPVSYDRVIIHISVCHKCQLVHKYVVAGHSLAARKNLMHVEGFYSGGIRVSDAGCLADENT